MNIKNYMLFALCVWGVICQLNLCFAGSVEEEGAAIATFDTYLNDADPQAGDALGAVRIFGNDTITTHRLFTQIVSFIDELAPSTENSSLSFQILIDGILQEMAGISREGLEVAAPIAAHEVRGSVDSNSGSLFLSGGKSGSNNDGASIELNGNDSADNGNMYLVAGNDSAGGEIAFFSGSGSERMRIDYDGNVGIGTSIARAKTDRKRQYRSLAKLLHTSS